MLFLAIRPCSGSASNVSGDGIVMDFQLSKKYRKNYDLNQIKKSKNQQVESRDLSMNVTPTLAILQQSGAGISIISVDGWIWRVRTARWIRTIWSRSCGSSNKSGRKDISTKGSVFRGILGSSRPRFQTLKSRWMTAIRMSRIQRLR